MLLLLLWKCFDILLQQDDKGDVSNRDNGSGLGRLSRLESDFGRALMENRTSLNLAPSGSNGQITISRISTLGFEGLGALVEGTQQTQRRLIRV
ncbi:hypothetical protein GQ457_14G017040 [Hibiscus cannabinus]